MARAFEAPRLIGDAPVAAAATGNSYHEWRSYRARESD